MRKVVPVRRSWKVNTAGSSKLIERLNHDIPTHTGHLTTLYDKPPYRSVFSRNSDGSRWSLMMADLCRTMLEPAYRIKQWCKSVHCIGYFYYVIERILLLELFCVVQSKLIHKEKNVKCMYFSEQIDVDLLHAITFLTGWLKHAAVSTAQHSSRLICWLSLSR
jgi:hypothetical protein